MWPQQQGGLLSPLRNNQALLLSMASGLLGAPSLGEGLSRGFAKAPLGMQADQSRAMSQYKLMLAQNEQERERAEQEERDKALQSFTQSQVTGGNMTPEQAQLYSADPELGIKLSPLQGVGNEYGLSPVWAQDAQGNPIPFQPSKSGAPRQMQFPEGYNPMAPGDLSYQKRAGTERAKTEAGQPQAQARANAAIQKSAQAADMARSLSQHKGMESATGPLQSRLPTVSEDTANFETELDTLKTKIFVNAIAEMRELSKTGGALGQVTEREIYKMENSMRNLALGQGDENMRRNLEQVARDFDEAQRNIAAAYEQQFGQEFQGFGGGSTGGVAQPQTGGTTSTGNSWKLVQ